MKVLPGTRTDKHDSAHTMSKNALMVFKLNFGQSVSAHRFKRFLKHHVQSNLDTDQKGKNFIFKYTLETTHLIRICNLFRFQGITSKGIIVYVGYDTFYTG